jgi:hypothetical protein
MNRIGVSFKSRLSPDEIRVRFVQPLRTAIEEARAGIYSNYLRQADDHVDGPDEHLLIFHVHEFETGLRLLRTTAEQLGPLPGLLFHNLDPSAPMY